jgi:hypothetical protein
MKRMARRALRIRELDLHCQELLAIRRQQALELLLASAPEPPPPPEPVVEVREVPVVVEPAEETTVEGPSSRDWMLMLMMVGGATGLVTILSVLTLLALLGLGILQPGMGGEAGSVSAIP